MSLAGAIEALRKAVPSSENRTELTEAAPVQAVPPVPSEPHENQKREASREGGPSLESQNGEVSDSSLSRNHRNLSRPLSDSALAELITTTAQGAKLSPADLWAFLSLEDIEALRTGNPEELNALAAFAKCRGRTGDRTAGGHDLPFPGMAAPRKDSRTVRGGDRADSRPDRNGDGHGIGNTECESSGRAGRGI